MIFTPGTRLGHYEIVASLGAGGMGEVYRATDSKLGRQIALKVLPAPMSTDPERLSRFQREARAVAALNHPHIVTIHSVEEFEGLHFLTMELVEGLSLDRSIPQGGFSVDRIVPIAAALAEALVAAHERGLVHRDLKPANVMLTPEGRVKVLDFGLAKDLRGTEPLDATMTSGGHTQAGVVMGTPAYMSPEQVAGRAVDHRTDLFSLGVILYEMASGIRPFAGATSIELGSAILRDAPRPLTDIRTDLPAGLLRVVGRCLEKDPRDRIQTARDVLNDLREVAALTGARTDTASARATSDSGSGATRVDEGFRVAVQPFKHPGTDADVAALAEGLQEEIVAGLARFSYLRVIARDSTSQAGVRYVMDGSLRRAGSRVRVSAKLVDVTTGAHLWADTYTRPFDVNELFGIQDDLIPRIVSTCADTFGVLARAIGDTVRGKDPRQLTPYEALMRGFAYHHRLAPADHAEARAALEQAVERAPANADCLAMLSWVYSHEYAHGFNPLPGSLDRALDCARRAVDLAPSNHLVQQALAVVLFFRKERAACLSACERALKLNPLDASNEAIFLITFLGQWERGCALVRRAMELNPHHPAWYTAVFVLDEYRRGNYRAAVDEVIKANAPGIFWIPLLLAASYGQLGELDAARGALGDLLAQKPDFKETGRQLLERWFEPELVEQLMAGLYMAGLKAAGSGGHAPASAPPSADTIPRSDPPGPPAPVQQGVALAVMPFTDLSAAKDQAYLCEGMAEEIMGALVRVPGIRVASRTSAFRAHREGSDLGAVARALSVGHVLEGSIRTSGNRLRVSAQLTDVASGYQVWSERFDRDAADVFAVQDEIAGGVVQAVKARLAPGAHAVQHRPHAHNLDAYRLYLKGRHLRGKEDHLGALRAFEEAVRLDPTHAPSWTGLAEIQVLAAHFSLFQPLEACATARAALAKAAALQGESADSLHVEAFAAYIERRWDAMESLWRRALELQPAHVLALGSFGIALSLLGKVDEATAVFERARAADPLASFPYALTGTGLIARGQAAEALRYLEDALTFEKEDATALLMSSVAKVTLGDFEGGIAAARHVADLSQRGAVFVGTLGWALAIAGRTEEALGLLEELRARKPSDPAVVAEAWLLGALGEVDAAFEVLVRAEQEYQPFVCFTGCPAFDSLRNDPRFTALQRRLQLKPV